MEKIASFQVDHLRMKRGIFVSRRDRFGDTVLTTFDIRMKEPNREPVMDVSTAHTIEHMGATFLRSHDKWAARTVYFGPMGCRTGFYAILEGSLTSTDALSLFLTLFQWILSHEGPVPGATREECGNWRDQNPEMARWEAEQFLKVLCNPLGENLDYPS